MHVTIAIRKAKEDAPLVGCSVDRMRDAQMAALHHPRLCARPGRCRALPEGGRAASPRPPRRARRAHPTSAREGHVWPDGLGEGRAPSRPDIRSSKMHVSIAIRKEDAPLVGCSVDRMRDAQMAALHHPRLCARPGRCRALPEGGRAASPRPPRRARRARHQCAGRPCLARTMPGPPVCYCKYKINLPPR